jgi:hypothetical protein
MTSRRLLCVSLLGLTACQALGEGPSADEYFYDCDDPARPAGLTTFATDDAFKQLSTHEAMTAPIEDDQLGPRLTAPVPGRLSAGTPPTFSFQAMAMAAPRAAGVRPGGRRPLRWLASLVEGTAQARCMAGSGENFLLRVNDGDTIAYTALASVTSFTPGATAWTRALDGRVEHQVTVTVERAGFVNGTLASGPYVATIAPAFTVAP